MYNFDSRRETQVVLGIYVSKHFRRNNTLSSMYATQLTKYLVVSMSRSEAGVSGGLPH